MVADMAPVAAVTVVLEMVVGLEKAHLVVDNRIAA